jgi:hypothetical protein
MKRITTTAAVLLASGVISAASACGGSGNGGHRGFDNPATLSHSVQQQEAKQWPGSQVKATCIPAGTPHDFVCNVTVSSNVSNVLENQQNLSVDVSAGGTKWTSSP